MLHKYALYSYERNDTNFFPKDSNKDIKNISHPENNTNISCNKNKNTSIFLQIFLGNYYIMDRGKTWDSVYWRKTDSESETEEEATNMENDSIKTAAAIGTGKPMSSKQDDTSDSDDNLSCTFSSDEADNDTFEPKTLSKITVVNEPLPNSKPNSADPRCNGGWTESKLMEIRQIEKDIRFRLTAPILIPSERASIVLNAKDPRQAAVAPIINRRWETSTNGKPVAAANNMNAEGDILTPILNSMTYINYPNLSFCTQGAEILPAPGTSETKTTTPPATKKKPKGSRNVPSTASKASTRKTSPKRKPKQQTPVRRRRKIPISREIIPTSSDDDQDNSVTTNKPKVPPGNTTVKKAAKKKQKVISAAAKKAEDSSDVVSDESWPTDKEEGLVTTKPEVGNKKENNTLDPLAQAVFQAGIQLISIPEVYDPNYDIEYDPANITYQPSLDTLESFNNDDLLTPPPSDAETVKQHLGLPDAKVVLRKLEQREIERQTGTVPYDISTEEDASPIRPELVRNPFAKDGCLDDGSDDVETVMGSWDETDSDNRIDVNSTTDDENANKSDITKENDTSTTNKDQDAPIKVGSIVYGTPVIHQPPQHQHPLLQLIPSTTLPPQVSTTPTLHSDRRASPEATGSLTYARGAKTNARLTSTKPTAVLSITKLDSVDINPTPKAQDTIPELPKLVSSYTAIKKRELIVNINGTNDTLLLLNFMLSRTNWTKHCILQNKQQPEMNAKNISKDRSTSRESRDRQKERFAKSRPEEDESMEQDDPPPKPNAGAGNFEGPKPGNTSTPGGGASASGGHKGYNTGGYEKRKRDPPPRTGQHDNTTTEDSGDDIPKPKRQSSSIREKITNAYQKKTQQTRAKREADGTSIKPSVQFDIDLTGAGRKIENSKDPLLEPTKLADAPVLKLQDLVPEEDRGSLDVENCTESIHSGRLEFVVVERVVDPEEEITPRADRDYDWEIPEREQFEDVIGKTINIFTIDNPADLQFLEFSSVGWNTGIGLFAFRSDKLEAMEQFREIVRGLEMEGKRFETYPKRMLLNRYALTVYFNAAFKRITDAYRLLFWIKQFNGFKGEMELVETRLYPADHPTRKGCKIVAFEADQTFLDELYKFPRDHAFSIRFGGNIYIRGGERIDPDDPDAVKSRRPRLSRNAAQKLLAGAGEEVFETGQKEEDAAAAKARAEHMKKHVSILSPKPPYVKLVGYIYRVTLAGLKIMEMISKRSFTGEIRGQNTYENDRVESKVKKESNYKKSSPSCKNEYYGAIFSYMHRYSELCQCAIIYMLYNYTRRTFLGKINGVFVPPPTLTHSFENIVLMTKGKHKVYELIKSEGNYKYNYCNMVFSAREGSVVTRSITDINRTYDQSSAREKKTRYKTIMYCGKKMVHTIQIFIEGSLLCLVIAAKYHSEHLIMVILSRGKSKTVMCKPKYAVPEANMISRRSLNITDGVGKIILCKHIMCKHRCGIPVTVMKSRRSLNIIGGEVKKVVIKQAKPRESYKGAKQTTRKCSYRNSSLQA